jgi:hypothetical protein
LDPSSVRNALHLFAEVLAIGAVVTSIAVLCSILDGDTTRKLAELAGRLKR